MSLLGEFSNLHQQHSQSNMFKVGHRKSNSRLEKTAPHEFLDLNQPLINRCRVNRFTALLSAISEKSRYSMTKIRKSPS